MFILLPVSDEGLPKDLDEKKESIQKILRRALELGFTCLADGTNASDDADARPGMKALQEMKGTADDALVVGVLTFDVVMAHHAGCKACAVTYGNGTRQQLASAEWIIDDFAELLEIVKE